MIKYVIVIIILLLLILYKIKNVETFKSSKTPIYVFWTGGYDSTFRICQLLINQRKVVQPVYVSAIIDNEPHKKTRRRNLKYEIKTMNIIRRKLYQKFPYTKNLLLPNITVKKINLDKDINIAMKNLHQLKLMRRPVCQYGGLAQVTRNLNKDIEICVENEPKTSMMFRAVKGSLSCKKFNCFIKKNLPSNRKPLKIFNRFIFSTITYSKQDMLRLSEKMKFKDILKLTWSCWYPKNGKPCRKCIMCKDRII